VVPENCDPCHHCRYSSNRKKAESRTARRPNRKTLIGLVDFASRQATLALHAQNGNGRAATGANQIGIVPRKISRSRQTLFDKVFRLVVDKCIFSPDGPTYKEVRQIAEHDWISGDADVVQAGGKPNGSTKQSQTISGNVQQGPVVVIRQAVNLLQTIAAQGSRCVGRSCRGEANC
jgi:hypothetical protein